MRKALYLDGTSACLEVGIDGPALRIRHPAQADARAPLRLLGRVVVSGDVAWHTKALLACMDAGIPVAFLTADGTPRGWCLGAAESTEDMNTLLEEACLRRDWPERHEDWVRAMERRSLLSALRDLALQPDDLRPSESWTRCETRIDALHAPVETTTIVTMLKGLLAAHLADLLRRHGIAARFAAGQGMPVRLIDDFTRVLQWDLWRRTFEMALYFCQHGGKHRSPTAVRRRIARRYEAIAPRIERRFADLFWRLRWHVREIRQ